MRGDPTPAVFDNAIIRSKDTIQVCEKRNIIDTTEWESEPIPCEAFRKFLLMVRLDSTGAPTTIQVKVKFLDRWSGEYYTYKQGLFAALFWEDTDTATAIKECFSGDCMGRSMIISLTGVGTTAAAYFTASLAVELYN